ncbi:MAG: hypothetical protein GEU99_20260 [Luteitalea sp.]|nr:hypothetical protein [Luteitalea sp.]
MPRVFRSIGPAIIVAAVVLGPGSILTSSQVGAELGYRGVPVIVGAVILMIGMVALSARIGAVYAGSPCDELASRLSRPVAALVGITVFVLIALFQSGNNIAVIAGLEPLFEGAHDPTLTVLTLRTKVSILVAVNLLVIVCLFLMRDVYNRIEQLMRILIAVMVSAFLVNFVVVFSQPRDYQPVIPGGSEFDVIPLVGMIGTTLSLAGAFFQAYLVKEKGWGLEQTRDGLIDSAVSISVLGLITAMILVTAARVFYGRPEAVELSSAGDMALQLEPSFGTSAKVIFCLGILAGALSSFLVNAMIGGTVLADSLGKGSRLKDKWPLACTTLALSVGMTVAILSLWNEGSTVALITLAQALTVFGIPALGLALVYLGIRSRREFVGERRIPLWIIALATLGVLVSCGLAYLTATRVIERLQDSAHVKARSTWPASTHAVPTSSAIAGALDRGLRLHPGHGWPLLSDQAVPEPAKADSKQARSLKLSEQQTETPEEPQLSRPLPCS